MVYPPNHWYSYLFTCFSSKMSKVAMTEVSVERCLLAMPDEIMFEIFRRLPKSKLSEISGLCSKFRNIAGDTRLWKDVYIKYTASDWKTNKRAAINFDDLYSGPWPVKVLDLRFTEIWRPVFSKIDQVVKVTYLYLSRVKANEVTMNAILTKYQCKELHLDWVSLDLQGRIMGIAPETFAKQTAVEVLSLAWIQRLPFDKRRRTLLQLPSCHQWLAPVLRNCKNLKTLNLSGIVLSNDDMLGFVENLPKSLKKLSLRDAFPEDSFFELLARSTPNLRKLELNATSVKCSSLHKLKFLEVLHVRSQDYQDISDLNVFIEKFPALKTVHVSFIQNHQRAQFEKLRNTLEPRGIFVDEQMEFMNEWPWPEHDVDNWVTYTSNKEVD